MDRNQLKAIGSSVEAKLDVTPLPTRGLLHFAGFCLTVLLSAGLFVSDSDAQTNRRKAKPKPTPTPVHTPLTGEPAIISRADDYPTVVIEPVPQNSTMPVGTPDPTIEELRERLLVKNAADWLYS